MIVTEYVYAGIQVYVQQKMLNAVCMQNIIYRFSQGYLGLNIIDVKDEIILQTSSKFGQYLQVIKNYAVPREFNSSNQKRRNILNE